jgi:hypothetical protein
MHKPADIHSVGLADRDTVTEILTIEWHMFKKVKSAFPTACQNNPEGFRRIRRTIFRFWPDTLLHAYLNDLQRAHQAGRNLFTEKYARMDGLLPPRAPHRALDRIIEIETAWQTALERSYPALFRRICRGNWRHEDGRNFTIYLRSELETYGDETLQHYLAWVEEGVGHGRNYSMVMLAQLVRDGGFEDLDQAEQYFSRKRVLEE